MSSLCIKNASVIVTCDDQDSVLENSSILIEDGVIRSIGQQTFSADEILDASGCMVYPGLINTHHHLYQTFSRNLPQVQNMELFEWLTTLYEIWKNLDSSIIYHSSVTGMGELLKQAVLPVLTIIMSSRAAVLSLFWKLSLRRRGSLESACMHPGEVWISVKRTEAFPLTVWFSQ